VEERGRYDNDAALASSTGESGIIRGRNIVDGEMLSRVSLALARVQPGRMVTVTCNQLVLEHLSVYYRAIGVDQWLLLLTSSVPDHPLFFATVSTVFTTLYKTYKSRIMGLVSTNKHVPLHSF
jgi:hypothetical protein